MPQQLKPVAPSVKDVKKQIREAIKAVKAKQTKMSLTRGTHNAKLKAKISDLTASLASAGSDTEVQKLLKRHEDSVGELRRQSSELNRHVSGYKVELKLLKKELASMDDLGD